MIYDKFMRFMGYIQYSCCGQYGTKPENYEVCSRCGALVCFNCYSWIGLNRLCSKCLRKVKNDRASNA
jgi:hypothetical protein